MEGRSPGPEPQVHARPPPSALLRQPDWLRYQGGRIAVTLGLQLQGVAVAWDVYRRTGRALDLAWVGLAQFAPAFLLTLVTGHVADRFDRRWVLAVTAAVKLAALGLFGLALGEVASVLPVYALLVVVGTARAFAAPAGSALVPTTVPTAMLPTAIATSSGLWQIVTIVGPATGGAAVALADDAAPVYAASALLQAVGVVMPLRIAPRPRATSVGPAATLDTVLAGIRYVRARPVLLGAISLDLFAVLLGGAVALLPVFAEDVLRVGAAGLGWMRSMPAVGAAAMAVVLAVRPPTRRVGAWMLGCVAVFGAATIVFGVSTRFELSLAALFVLGASDMVSVYVRTTLVQLRTPDEMRGRVSAVNMVFVGASNELGEFESGLTAELLGGGAVGAVRAVVIGGVGTLLVVALWARAFPALRRVDRIDDVVL
jgi:MFS family permease